MAENIYTNQVKSMKVCLIDLKLACKVAYYHPDLQFEYLGANSKRGTYFPDVCACFINQTQMEL